MMHREEETNAPLWKDRKRILGLPITFTRYEVTNDRFITHRGLFNTETDETLLYRILDIKLVRRFGQKIFGVGTVVLYSADKSNPTFEVKNIKNPRAVHTFLSKAIEQARVSKGLTGREIYGVAGAAHVDINADYAFEDSDGDGIPD